MIAALAAAAALAAGTPAAGPPAPSGGMARAGDAVAVVTGAQASLEDGEIAQRWSIRGQVRVAALADPRTGASWASGPAPEFSLTLDAVPTSALSGWQLISVTAAPAAADPARPGAGRGVEIVFRYGLGGLELDRTWTLYPGAALEGVSATLINRTASTWRVGAYSLAQVGASPSLRAEVLAYHGGSDWRQDFRASSAQAGAFDQEGEVVRLDDGHGEGWFMVGQRRSGAMSRVARDGTGLTWVGVDNARDAFDAGPILSSPPNYNRIVNPTYPAPVRQRTLAPGGTLDLGEAYLGVYHGGPQQAGAAFAAAFAAHAMPTARQTVDLNSFHPWEHGPGLSDRNLRPQARLFQRLGGEVFMLDDQWQGKSSGDWQWDRTRFPISGVDGVPDFVHYLHSLGLELGLWMSPAEFNPSSRAYREHPQWACGPTGDVTAQIPDDSGLGVWDMTNPAVRSHLDQVIDRLIAQDGVREFKFDYVTWVDCPPHDYLDYEDAYAAWVHGLEARHPGVTFELDETNDQRLWPFRSLALGPSWFDNGHIASSQYPARLLHDIWSAAPWIPPSSLGFGTYDKDLGGPYSVDYLMPMALLGHITFWSELTKLTSAQLRETAWWVSWYEAHRDVLAGVVYEDTPADPADGTAWAVFQPWSAGHGYLFEFRQASAASRVTVHPEGLERSQSYRLTDVRTGKVVGTFAGAQLERGLPLTLPARYSARVLSLDPRPSTPRRRGGRRGAARRRAHRTSPRRPVSRDDGFLG